MSDSREWTAARDEYTYQLVQEIAPRILEIFEEIYSKCKEEAGEESIYDIDIDVELDDSDL